MNINFLHWSRKMIESKNSEVKKGIVLSEPVKIEWLGGKVSLSQVYTTGLEYSFISRDWKQCCPFVYCKDFLQDALMAQYHNQNVSIHGFNFHPQSNEPLYTDRLRIALTNSSDDNFADKISHVIDFLHQFERKLKLIRSQLYPVVNPPKKYKKCGVFVIESSSRWMISPPMLSMYSLLLRVGFTHKQGQKYQDTIKNLIDGKTQPYQKSDHLQIKSAEAGIDKILENGYAKIFYKDNKKNYPNIGISTMHNYMGIVAFSQGMSRSYCKHWHRDLNKQKKKKV